MRESHNHSQIALVAVAGSAGGSVAMCEILARLPADFPSPIVYVQHLSRSCRSELAEVLQYHTVLKVRWARQGDRLAAGVVYVCPAGSSLTVNPDGSLTLVPVATLSERLRAADCFFTSIAASYGCHVVAIVLSGAGWDGSEGLCALHEQRGTVVAQDEDSAFVWGMPQAAIAAGCVDSVLSPQEIAPVLVNIVRDGHPPATVPAKCSQVCETRQPVSVPGLPDTLGKFLARALTI